MQIILMDKLKKNKVTKYYDNIDMVNYIKYGPAYATEGDAGLDIRCCEEKEFFLYPGQTKLVSTGLKIWIDDPKLAGMLIPRSGLGHKNNLVLGNGTGLLDSTYQGELFVSLWNRSQDDISITINPGDKIAQLVIVPVVQASFEVVDKFHAPTVRGDGGFNSTGLK